jgi:aminomethyltransferase
VETQGPLRRTKLFDWHAGAGARMLGFGGWEMPIQYPSGPREEHLAVRRAAGLFDIDHMGRLAVRGPQAIELVQRVQSWDAARVAPGAAHYGLLCAESGGIIDDIFLYHLEPAEWLLIVNAANREKDLAWILSHAGGLDASVKDVSAESCMIALQGPAAAGVMERLGSPGPASQGWHRVARAALAGIPCTVCTTGYTGEPGYEILAPGARGRELWEALLAAGAPLGVVPAGLAARDTLRAEAALPLYGHEISEDTDPFSAGLGAAAVSLEGHEFVGRQALAARAARPPARSLAGFRMTEAAVPRQGYPIRVPGGPEAGAVSTGLYSPSTGEYIGMGYVETAFAREGQGLEVVIRGAGKAACVVPRPFYRSPHWSGRKGR